jgi:anti-anti-sigma factor
MSGADSDLPKTGPIDLQVTFAERYAVVAVSGEIDISSAPALRDAIDEAIASGAALLIVDLDAVAFMDSSGLNALIGATKRLRPGALRVVAGQTHIRRIFSITGTDKVIPVFDCVDAAVGAATEIQPTD